MDHQLTIVIVDDSRIICDRITSLLGEIPGIGAVYSANSFREGLQLITLHAPDVAVLDINLPDKSGIELLRTIRTQRLPVQKIIIMTEDASEIKRQKCLQLGAHHFLNKFTDFEKIADIIADYRN